MHPSDLPISDLFNAPAQFGVYIPNDLAGADPATLKVYIRLVILAKESGSNSIELPARDEFAAVCNLSRDVIRRSLIHLHRLTWIHISNLNSPGKTLRRRITIRYDEPRIINQRIVVEMMEAADRRSPRILPGPPADPVAGRDLSAIRSLVSQIQIHDTQGRRIGDLTDQEILEACKAAPSEEIAIAFKELSLFTPKDGSPIRSIYGVLARMFIRSKSERIGMLNPHRKSLKLSSQKFPYVQKTRSGESKVAAFYPADLAGMPASHIDYVCTVLNSRSWIEAGLIPIRQLADHDSIFERHPTEPQVRLRDEFRLKKVKAGFWNIEFEKITTALKRKALGSTEIPGAIGESISRILAHG
jgi:hypothetical protein